MDLSLASVTICCVIQEQTCMKKHDNKLEKDTNHGDTQAFQRQVPEVEFKGR